MENIILNLEQAAGTCGVSVPTMRCLVRRGDFPAFKIGSRWMIPRTALEEWAQRQAENRVEFGGVRK
jgi:excisionase family DNA binding protein